MAEYKNWEILFRFSCLRNWRVVEAEDASGKRRRCLLLPMDCNGIMLSDNGNYPYMRLLAPQIREERRGNDGFFRSIIPMITKDNHEIMLREGDISPNEKNWAISCGGIRTADWARKYKDNYYLQKKDGKPQP